MQATTTTNFNKQLARAKMFKNELALKEINASNSEVETQAA